MGKRDLDKIVEKIEYQKVELQHKGFKAKYLFIDKITFNELRYNAVKFSDTIFEYANYLQTDKFMGLLVIPLSMVDEFISVGL